jgi:hypothetical protein
MFTSGSWSGTKHVSLESSLEECDKRIEDMRVVKETLLGLERFKTCGLILELWRGFRLHKLALSCC